MRNASQKPTSGIDCPSCGSNVVRTLKRQKFPYGQGPEQVWLEATVPVMTCPGCEEEFVDSEGEEVRHKAVCHYLGRLSPEEIRLVREKYALSQDDFSKLTGYGTASIKRWETGALIQNDSADRFIRLLNYPDNYYRLERFRTRSQELGKPKRFQTVITQTTREQGKVFQLRPSVQQVA